MKDDEMIQICCCSSFEHQLIWWWCEDDKILYVHPHLASKSFFKRLKYGVKYIFGYKSRFGAWDECLFDKEQLNELLNFLNKQKRII